MAWGMRAASRISRSSRAWITRTGRSRRTLTGRSRCAAAAFARAFRSRRQRSRTAGSGRGERIRTSGLYVPNVALYQAKLHPEAEKQRGDESAPFSLCRLELSLDRKVRQL